MISEKENIRLSKFLSLVLRHKPETIGIQLDENGWVDVTLLLNNINDSGLTISREILQYIVETNSKKRFVFDEGQTKIRASQGHSLEIELGYEPIEPPSVLYHGTTMVALNSIRLTGIEKRSRHHVHMSLDIETARIVGKRYGEPVILRIAATEMHANGYKFYCSENNVWLVNDVPVKYITTEFGEVIV